MSHRDAGAPDLLRRRGDRRLGSVPLSAKVNPADPNADHSDPVTVLLATALAAGVTPAELETAVRGPSSRPGAQSAGRPEDGSRGRGSRGDRAADLGE